jgi:hypothetical protein
MVAKSSVESSFAKMHGQQVIPADFLNAAKGAALKKPLISIVEAVEKVLKA